MTYAVGNREIVILLLKCEALLAVLHRPVALTPIHVRNPKREVATDGRNT